MEEETSLVVDTSVHEYLSQEMELICLELELILKELEE